MSLVEARISVEGDDAFSVLGDLYDWLGREDELRGRVRFQRAPAGPHEMGAVAEIITVAVGAGGAATVLGSSLTTWLAQRKSDVRIKVTGASGRTAEADVRRVSDPQAIIREIAAVVMAAEDDGNGAA